MRAAVVVTGLGAITSVGHTVSAMWAALLAGYSGVGPISHFDASALTTQIAAKIQNFEPRDYFGVRASP